jgi:hypothetical protein
LNHQREVGNVGVTPDGTRPVSQPQRAVSDSAIRVKNPEAERVEMAMVCGMVMLLHALTTG